MSIIFAHTFNSDFTKAWDNDTCHFICLISSR